MAVYTSLKNPFYNCMEYFYSSTGFWDLEVRGNSILFSFPCENGL